MVGLLVFLQALVRAPLFTSFSLPPGTLCQLEVYSVYFYQSLVRVLLAKQLLWFSRLPLPFAAGPKWPGRS